MYRPGRKRQLAVTLACWYDSRMSILLVGSGTEISHADLMAGLRRDTGLLLVEPGPVTWQRRYVEDALEVPPADGEAAVAAALRLAADHQVTAILTYLEPLLELAATIAERAGIRGMSRSAAAIVRDKSLQREALRSALPLPTRSVKVANLADARVAAAEIGFPVVIKPRNFSGGLGVHFAVTPELLDEAWRATVATRPRDVIVPAAGALIEELLVGPHFSVNCWVLDGEAGVLSTSRAWDTDPMSALTGGWVMGRDLAAEDVLVRIEQAACQAATACGLNGTIADVELVLMDGEPRVLEVNGRPAGDQAVRMAALSSGVDLGRALAAVAQGRRPDQAPPVRRAAGIVFVYPPKTMDFGALQLASDLRKAAWLDRWHATATQGQKVTPPPEDPWGRVGWLLVSGADAAHAESRMVAARRGVRVLDHSAATACAS